MITAVPKLARTTRNPSAPAPRLRVAAALLWALAPGQLNAQPAAPANAIEPPRRAQAPEPLCFCWNEGRKITEGATACIRTTQGRRLALCGRVINMMSWEVSETPCPES